MNQKETFLNVSLPLHWASLRSPSISTASTTARNIWNLARAFLFQQELKLSCWHCNLLFMLKFCLRWRFLR